MMLLVITVTSFMFFWFSYRAQRDTRLGAVDEKLRISAIMLREVFPESYHDEVHENYFTDQEYEEVVRRNNEISDRLGLQYLWSSMKVGDDVFFTSSTSPSKDVDKQDYARFFEKHTDPAAFDEVFSTMETTYSSFYNIWGHGRMVLVPYTNADGYKYCFGASLSINSLYEKLRELRLQYLLLFLMVILLGVLISVPLSKSLSNPIRQLVRDADSMSEGDLSPKPQISGIKEVELLSRSMNEMGVALDEKMKEIQESQRRFRDLTESTSDVIWEIDDKFVITYVSPQIKGISGRDPDEIMGRSFFEFLKLEEQNDIKDNLTSFFDEKRDFKGIEMRRVHKDGRAVIVESSGVVYFKADGSFGGYRGIDRDVTHRRMMMRKIRLSEERYALAQNVAGIGSWDWNMDTGKLYWTDNIYIIFGVSKEEFSGTFEDFLKLVHPDDRSHVSDSIQRSMKREVEYNIVHRIIRPNGTIRWVSESGNVLSDERGRAKRMLGIVQDITKRKEYEQERESLIDQLQQKARQLEEAKNTLDLKAQELEAANEELEVSNEELQTRGEELESANEELQISYEELQETTGKLEEAKIELEYLNENLERSVRERTKELESTQEKLIRSERLAVLGKVAGSLSHELRNPLAVMKNIVYLLTKSPVSVDDTKLKKHLDILKKQIEISDRVISSALDYTRPTTPEVEDCDVNDAIKDALEEIDIPSNVTLKENYTKDPIARCDRFLMKQVFRNIVTNSLQAMDQGGEIKITTQKQDGKVLSRISDTGPGIEPSHLEEVFEPLFSTKPRGIGLGLSIVKDIVQSHSGSVEIESEQGTGACFTIILPAA